ncbi:MAG TPA: secretin N-terminal domain-containing protein [Lacipirellulaceae bacterium]|nr:secretin N-terminal domain-containing protein [Lacipirellulaceae bacterium]
MAWQQRAAGRTDIRIAIDERTSQALVFASPAVQAQIQQELTAKAAFATPGVSTAATPNIGLTAPGGAALFQLRQLPASDVHARLESLLAHPLPATFDASGEWQTFRVEASPGVGATVSVNSHLGQVRIDGPPAQVAAWRSVIEAMDAPKTSDDKVTRLITTQPANHDRVRQALEVLRADSASRSGANTSVLATVFQQNTSAGGTASSTAGAPAQNQQPATTEVVPGGGKNIAEAAKAAEASGLLGPVQVEYIEGLDVIVLRGSEHDVQRVMDIIKQIEQLSTITVPAVEIYPLKNVDSVRMSTLLQRLYEQVLQQRIGSVNITPLGTPNALLLVGRTENVKMAIDLVQRLDQPVIPTSRFEVFPLKHAAAPEAKTLIDSFLGQTQEGGGTTGTTAPRTSTSASGTAASAEAAASTPALEPRANVVADPRTNSLVVIASPRDMAEIAALIQRIDTPGASAELKVFTIVNGDAQALADMLRSMFSVPAQPQGGGGGAATGGAAEGGGGLGQGGPVRMQFSVDPRTNSIIAVGSREDLVVVESILLRLDQGDLRERKTKVYRLNNAFSQEVAQALNQWLQTQQQTENQPELALSPFEQIDREVIVVPEVATNSLIVSATPRYFDEVIGVIQKLDERPPMVLIQVLIAQVQLNDADQFGVELGLQDSVLFDRSLLTDVVNQSITNTSPNGVQTTTQNIISATGTPGFNWNTPTAQAVGNNVASTLNQGALSTAGRVGTQALSNFAVNRVDPSLGFSGFVFSASSDAVSMLLRALQQKQRLEVLSRPQLMALDGQRGRVVVGQDVPTVTNINQTTFGQTNTITYRQVGLILDLTPRISPDGLIVMQISAEKSQISDQAGVPIGVSVGGQALNAPIINDTQAITTISALSGQTVVLGGLIETSKNDLHRRVPVIADIPLLGDLFRYDSVIESRSELLIILTPQLIYNRQDSDLVKQIESSRMSWILSDVVNIHGEAGLRSRCDEWSDIDMESIYPNFIPEEGFLPLSKSKPSPTGEPTRSAPNCETCPTVAPPVNKEEPIPVPPPTPKQPITESFSTGSTASGVQSAQYLAPVPQTPSVMANGR